jgi:hypothetical protein
MFCTWTPYNSQRSQFPSQGCQYFSQLAFHFCWAGRLSNGGATSGRVDFANMPAFNTTNVAGVPPKSETDLIKQYLNKTHGFRNKTFQFADRSTVGWSYTSDVVFESADRTTSHLYGSDTTRVDAGDPLTVIMNSHLFGFAAGFGGPSSMSVGPNNHYSADLADPAKEPMVGFYVLSASYFGAWHLQDDFLRATIATPNYGLGAIYGRHTSMYLEPLALGEPAFTGVARTINNQYVDVEIALLGDPSLRCQITTPPSNVVATTSQGAVTLNWTQASEPNVLYLVYRSTNGLDGDFVKLSAAITSLTFTDSSPPSGPKMYAVRAAKLLTTCSGSFTNLSQSAFATINQ